MKTLFAEKGTDAGDRWADGIQRFHSSHTGSTILLISNDGRFHENLRSLANEVGLMVAKADRAVGMLAVLQAVSPGAVLLDLDLPDEAAWKTADILLNEPACPALILVTGRTGHFAMQSAIRAGSLLSKSDSPGRLMRIIEETLEMPGSDQAQRNAIQRELIRWLRPLAWAADAGSACPFRGINE